MLLFERTFGAGGRDPARIAKVSARSASCSAGGVHVYMKVVCYKLSIKTTAVPRVSLPFTRMSLCRRRSGEAFENQQQPAACECVKFCALTQFRHTHSYPTAIIETCGCRLSGVHGDAARRRAARASESQ
eukprot:2010927-Pleurochrysis_carterae.AAC.2